MISAELRRKFERSGRAAVEYAVRTHRIKNAQELDAANEWLTEQNEAEYKERREERRHNRIERWLTWAILAAILVDMVWNHWKEFFPEVHVQYDPSAPFSVPFYVKNPSSLFDMKDVKWSCRARWEDHIGGRHTLEGVGGTVGTVSPGEAKHRSCEISAPADTQKFLTAELTVQYRTILLGERKPATLALKWGSGSWVESDTP